MSTQRQCNIYCCALLGGTLIEHGLQAEPGAPARPSTVPAAAVGQKRSLSCAGAASSTCTVCSIVCALLSCVQPSQYARSAAHTIC